jgi:MscS family membrane protein
VQQDTVSVRFEKLEDLSALLRIDGGVMTQDFQEYLAVAEDLNLRILDAVEEAGLYLCGPGQTVVLQQPDEVSHQIAK